MIPENVIGPGDDERCMAWSQGPGGEGGLTDTGNFEMRVNIFK